MTFFGGWGDIHMLCKYHISVYGYHKGTKFNPLLFNDAKPWLSNHASSSDVRIKKRHIMLLVLCPTCLMTTQEHFTLSSLENGNNAKYKYV